MGGKGGPRKSGGKTFDWVHIKHRFTQFKHFLSKYEQILEDLKKLSGGLCPYMGPPLMASHLRCFEYNLLKLNVLVNIVQQCHHEAFAEVGWRRWRGARARCGTPHVPWIRALPPRLSMYVTCASVLLATLIM
jgi:hypothetical protein